MVVNCRADPLFEGSPTIPVVPLAEPEFALASPVASQPLSAWIPFTASAFDGTGEPEVELPDPLEVPDPPELPWLPEPLEVPELPDPPVVVVVVFVELVED